MRPQRRKIAFAVVQHLGKAGVEQVLNVLNVLNTARREGREGVQHLLAQKWCCTCSTPPPEVVLNMVCTTPAQR